MSGAGRGRLQTTPICLLRGRGMIANGTHLVAALPCTSRRGRSSSCWCRRSRWRSCCHRSAGWTARAGGSGWRPAESGGPADLPHALAAQMHPAGRPLLTPDALHWPAPLHPGAGCSIAPPAKPSSCTLARAAASASLPSRPGPTAAQPTTQSLPLQHVLGPQTWHDVPQVLLGVCAGGGHGRELGM